MDSIQPIIRHNKRRKFSQQHPTLLRENITRRKEQHTFFESSSSDEDDSTLKTNDGLSLLNQQETVDEETSLPQLPAQTVEDYRPKTLSEQALAAIETLRQANDHQQEEENDDGMPKPPDFNASFLCTEDSDIVWHYDATNRIVRADCTEIDRLGAADVGKLAYLMERDDLVLITKGLFMKLDDIDNFLSYLSSNRNVYHKFRRFVRDNNNGFVEVDGYVEMTPDQYVQYLELLHTMADETVTYSRNGIQETCNVRDIRLYMVDVDMSVLYPQLQRTYEETCKWRDVLPGGKLCMMGEIPKPMQPFMGPNLYVTPGGTYTRLHQDGFGSVDSGHSNLYGTNEVILLRRLPELHKKRACDILREDALYRLPHDDDTATHHEWPTHEIIKQWEALHYCPARFLLLAGEHVHINKGRLHAFRKLSNEPLPEHDCHAEIRHEFLQNHTVDRNICVSIAYDWMYLGFQATAIETEIKTVLDAARNIRQIKHTKTLAVGETAVFALAETVAAGTLNIPSLSVVPDKTAIAQGIFRPLSYLVYRDEAGARGVVAPIDADEDPEFRPTDPYGNDYFCKICHNELANTYFHCQGCEQLLQMDFNICTDCFLEKRYRIHLEMKPYANGKAGCHLHHNASTSNKPCTSKHGGCACDNVCQECTCVCHEDFIKRHRFRSDASARKLLEDCAALAGRNLIPLG